MTQGLLLFDNSTRGELLLREPETTTTNLHKIPVQSLRYKFSPVITMHVFPGPVKFGDQYIKTLSKSYDNFILPA